MGSDGFEIIHIPECSRAVFKCVGPSPVAEYELIPDYDIENYLPGDLTSPDYVNGKVRALKVEVARRVHL